MYVNKMRRAAFFIGVCEKKFCILKNQLFAQRITTSAQEGLTFRQIQLAKKSHVY